MNQKLITTKDIVRLRGRLTIFVVMMVGLFALTLVVPVNVADSSDALQCSSTATQLGQYLLGSTFACWDVALGRLLIYAAIFVLVVWLASASVAESGWKGLINSIFTPDGNESPVLTLLVYLLFLFATAANVKFTFWPNFLVATVYYVARNSLIGMAFILTLMKVVKIQTIEAYLREQATPFSNGLPMLQVIALLMAFYLPRVFGG